MDCRLTSTKMQTSSRHSSGRAGRTWKCALLTFCNMRYIHYFPPHVIQCFTTPAMLHNLCLPRLSVHCSLSAICNFFLPYSLCKGLVSQSIVKSYFARGGPSCRWKFHALNPWRSMRYFPCMDVDYKLGLNSTPACNTCRI